MTEDLHDDEARARAEAEAQASAVADATAAFLDHLRQTTGLPASVLLAGAHGAVVAASVERIGPAATLDALQRASARVEAAAPALQAAALADAPPAGSA